MKEYYIFVDESGTPNLKSIDPQYPVFGVGAIVFEKEYFDKEFTLNFEKLKISNGFEKNTVFHSSEIRKQKNEFRVLTNKDKREKLLSDITTFFSISDFVIISSVIKMKEFKDSYETPGDPYDLAFLFILERVQHFLYKNNGTGHFVIEQRTENKKSLQSVFDNVKSNGNGYTSSTEFQRYFPQKKLTFVTKENRGVQVADLLIYPVTSFILREKEPPAFEMLKSKMYKGYCDQLYKYGLKIFP